MTSLAPILLVNAAIGLIVGIAMLLAWRRNVTQRFARDIGWAFLVQAFAPAGFATWRFTEMPWRALGGATLVACAAGYLVLMIAGAADLAGRRLATRTLAGLAAVLALVIATALRLEPQIAQAVTSSAHLVVGAVAATWLWRLGRAERLAGVLLILLALTHYGFAAFGEAALPIQASAAAALRAALGLTLLFAALDRWDGLLARQPFLCGEALTLADVAFFTTLYRFDPVYHGHFKCNLRRIVDYPSLWPYVRRIYQTPGVRETCHEGHVKQHYYRSHPTINPTRIVPKGPVIDYDAPV